MKSYPVTKHKVGSKLYLSGEYSITVAKQQAIILFMQKYTFSTIQEANQYEIKSDLFDYSIDLTSNNDTKYQLIIDTILFVNQYLNELNIIPKKFKLHITSELYEDKVKYGLGSSGSVVALIIKSILNLHNIDFNHLDLFKLCAIFLTLKNDNGSFGDLACICFEENVIYRNFDRSFIQKDKLIKDLLNEDFNSLSITQFKFQFPIHLFVIWSKQEASSSSLVKAIKLNPTFLENSNELISKYIDCNNFEDFKKIMHHNRLLLQNLSELIETTQLQTICETCENQNIACKSSGAGGGDCCIAFSNNSIKPQTPFPIIMEVTYE